MDVPHGDRSFEARLSESVELTGSRNAATPGETPPEAGLPDARGAERRKTQVALALAAVYLIWGSSYLATKILVTQEPPLFAAGLRFMLAGVLLGTFAWWRGGPPRMSWLELRHLAVIVPGAILISNGCNVVAMQYVASNVVALLNATPALIIAWLGTFGRRATSLSRRAWVGLVVGLAGVALVLTPPADASSLNRLGWHLLVLVGCVGWSLATVYFSKARTLNNSTMFLAIQMLIGGAGLIVCAAAFGEPLAMTWTVTSTAAFLWLTIMSSCIAYSAYMFLAVTTTPAVVGTYAYVNPAVATLLGWLVLGETLSVPRIAGMAVILVAVALVTGYRGPRMPDVLRIPGGRVRP